MRMVRHAKLKPAKPSKSVGTAPFQSSQQTWSATLLSTLKPSNTVFPNLLSHTHCILFLKQVTLFLGHPGARQGGVSASSLVLDQAAPGCGPPGALG